MIATPEGFRTLVEGPFGISFPKMSPDGSRIAYRDGNSIHMVDVATGEPSEVALGKPAWLDDDTLIVAP